MTFSTEFKFTVGATHSIGPWKYWPDNHTLGLIDSSNAEAGRAWSDELDSVQPLCAVTGSDQGQKYRAVL